MKGFTPASIKDLNRLFCRQRRAVFNMVRGFTLIETIVVIFVFTLIMGAVSGLIVMGYRVHGYTWEQSQAIDEARKGIEIMVKEIRESQSAENGAYSIEEAQDFQFVFYSDIDKDREIEKVRYFLENGELKKGVVQSAGWPPVYSTSTEDVITISSYVVNLPPIFRYFDAQGNELPAPARKKDTKLIRVYLVINVNPNTPPQNMELVTEVLLRNLKREWY